MNERKYELMEKYLNGEVTVSGLIDIIVELEGHTTKESEPEFELAEYVYSSIREAESVLDKLKEFVKKYGNVSVADYYELIGHGSTFMDNGRGWDANALHKTKVLAKHDLRDEAYYIKFPPVEVF